MRDDRRTVEVGARVAGRYEIEARAGGGGMGTVYRARDRVGGAVVAVKVLSGNAPAARFVQEARLLGELDHPAIVRYVTHGIGDDGRPFLVMEWLEGEDLAARLARGPLPLPEALALVRRIAEALAVAHGRGVIHRDVKPANVFLVGGDAALPKVLDFGIARARLDDDGRTHLPSTRTGAVLGTVGYMSPEQARGGQHVDARTDVFALGCVLHECLTGQPAFAGANAVAVLAKVLLEDPPVVPGMPSAVTGLLARLLAKDPARRPRDAEHVAGAIASLESLATSAGPSSGGVATREQRLVSIVLARGFEGSKLPPDLRDVEGEALELADGSLLLALRGTDPASRAASIALALRAARPSAAIAVASGRVDEAREGLVGPIIDRAATMLAGGEARVAVDDLSASLLGDRYAVAGAEGQARTLLGLARAHVEPRTLLGKRTPFLGRDKELALLEATLGECAEESAARAVLVTAPAGGGKSRLLHELLAKVPAETTVLASRGDPVGAGSALGAVRQLVRDAARVRDGDPPAVQHAALRAHLETLFSGDVLRRTADVLGELVGAPSPAPGPELASARDDQRLLASWFRRAFGEWIAALSDAGPLLVVLEDLHWGDPTSVAWLEDALRANATRPLMVLALARPEVHEVFATPFGKVDVQTMRLPGLTRRAAERLVRAVLDAPSDALVEQIVTRAEGNAFFLEELIRHAASGAAVLPESVIAVAEERIAHLDPERRRVLRAASIFGDACWPAAVAAVLDDAAQGALALDSRLQDLVRDELLVVRAASRYAGHDEYGFRHGLLRDVAHATLTEEDRAACHRRAAAWLEGAGESDALVIAEHLEQAGEAARAAPYLLAAAERAADGLDVAATAALVARARRTEPEDAIAGRLSAAEAAIAMSVGDVKRAAEAAKDAYARLPPGTSHAYRAAAMVLTTGPSVGDFSAAPRIVHELLTSDPVDTPNAAYGFAVQQVTAILDSLDQLEASQALVDRARATARRSPDPAPGLLGWLAFTETAMALRRDAALGETARHAARALAEFERAGDPTGLTFITFGSGVVAQEVGQWEDARTHLRAAASAFAKGGAALFEVWCALHEATIHYELGELRDAIRVAGKALYSHEHRHARALSALALVDLGELEEAEAQLADALDGLDDVLVTGFVVALVHLAHAQLLLARGDAGAALAAVERARSKRGLSPATVSHADLLHVRALAALRRTDDAQPVLHRAVARIERHACSLDASRAGTWRAIPANAWLLARAKELL